MVKLKVVDDGLVANPLHLKTGNEYISITSGEIFVPRITSLKTSSIKEFIGRKIHSRHYRKGRYTYY